MNALIRFLKDEEGAAAVEYGLLAALIAMVVIVGVRLLGTNICGVFNGIALVMNGTNQTYAWTQCS
jgi:pilus assembly protein Flp/PilA